MFEGNFADMCAEKFLLVSMGSWAEGQACVDPGARTPIGVSENFNSIIHVSFYNYLNKNACYVGKTKTKNALGLD